MISFLNGKPATILNDSTFIFINDYPNTNDIFITQDSGLTFKPSKLPDYQKTGNSLNDITHTIYYFGENGKGFIDGYVTKSTKEVGFSIKNKFAYTNDGGKTIEFNDDIKLNYGTSSSPGVSSNVSEIENKFLFAINYPTGQYNYFSLIFIDISFSEFTRLPWDSLQFIHHILADNPEKYLLFTTPYDTLGNPLGTFEVQQTLDSGKTRETILSIDNKLEINQIYELNKDSVFISCSSPDRLYLYDRQRNKIDTLYKGIEDKKILLMIVSDKFYIVGEKIFLENTNRDDLTQWQPAEWDFGLPIIESVIFKGNVALALLEDEKRQKNYYRIMLKDTSTTVIEHETEKKYYTGSFYSYPPYPMPGSDEITARIYWDKSFDLWEGIQGVYNVFGEKLEGRENMELTTVGIATMDLKWNCGAIPSGVYFIVVNFNGSSDCIPLVVQK